MILAFLIVSMFFFWCFLDLVGIGSGYVPLHVVSQKSRDRNEVCFCMFGLYGTGLVLNAGDVDTLAFRGIYIFVACLVSRCEIELLEQIIAVM